LADLKAQGVIGIAFNPSLHGFAHYADIEPLLMRLKALDLWAQFQVEKDLLLDFMPMLERVQGKMMFDHCGRPTLDADIQQAGFQTLLALGREGRAVVKVSGYAKFSQAGCPGAKLWRSPMRLGFRLALPQGALPLGLWADAQGL
jgi:predicted TIM-barrel fold metal-dependent hydrolase